MCGDYSKHLIIETATCSLSFRMVLKVCNQSNWHLCGMIRSLDNKKSIPSWLILLFFFSSILLLWEKSKEIWKEAGISPKNILLQELAAFGRVYCVLGRWDRESYDLLSLWCWGISRNYPLLSVKLCFPLFLFFFSFFSLFNGQALSFVLGLFLFFSSRAY